MKITLRELFLLVAMAAMGCGWWIDDTRRIRAEQALSDERLTQAEKAADREKLIRGLLEENRDREYFQQNRREVIQELTAALKVRGILWYRANDGEIRLSDIAASD